MTVNFTDYLYEYHKKINGDDIVSKKTFIARLDIKKVSELAKLVKAPRIRPVNIWDIKKDYQKHKEVHGDNSCSYSWFVYRYNERGKTQAIQKPRKNI